MATDQGGTPDAPRGCHVAAMPVRQAHPPRWSRSSPRAPLAAAGTNPHSGSARWITPCSLRVPRTVRSANTPAAVPIGMATAIASRRRAQECPPAVLSSRRTKVTAARDPHPPGGRDRRYRARGAGRVREHGDAAPFRPSGDLTAEHHGCGRCCSLFVLIATPCGPASRPSLPAPALARSTLPATRVRVRHQGRRREAPAASF